MKTLNNALLQWAIGLIVAGMMAGCIGVTSAPLSTPPAGGLPSPTWTPVLPTSTPAPAQATSTPRIEDLPSPTWTPVPPTSTPASAQATSTPGTQTVRVYLIALEDNGKSGKLVGCGDSAVPGEMSVTADLTDETSMIKAALGALLSIRWTRHEASGLYNALWQSHLEVGNVSIEGGTATVHLAGAVLLAGTCDTPRFKAQIEETIRQFPSVKEVAVFINGLPLDQVLSLR